MSHTYCLSLLCPAFATKAKDNSTPDFMEMCTQNMGLNMSENNVEFFKLVKFNPNEVQESDEDFVEIAVRLKNSEFSLKNVEVIIQQKEKLQDQIDKMKEAISSYAAKIGMHSKLIDFLIFIFCYFY